MQLFQSMHTTTHRNGIEATSAEPAARAFVLAEPVLREVQGRARVFVYCAVWRRVRWGGELACLLPRAGPGQPCGLVFCVWRLVLHDVLGVCFSSSVPLIERLTNGRHAR